MQVDLCSGSICWVISHYNGCIMNLCCRYMSICQIKVAQIFQILYSNQYILAKSTTLRWFLNDNLFVYIVYVVYNNNNIYNRLFFLQFCSCTHILRVTWSLKSQFWRFRSFLMTANTPDFLWLLQNKSPLVFRQFSAFNVTLQQQEMLLFAITVT